MRLTENEIAVINDRKNSGSHNRALSDRRDLLQEIGEGRETETRLVLALLALKGHAQAFDAFRDDIGRAVLRAVDGALAASPYDPSHHIAQTGKMMGDEIPSHASHIPSSNDDQKDQMK